MRLDELYKFCDGTLNEVWTALDDRLKGIQMEYLPQTIWRNSDKERATEMIQKINKTLKSRRIMRSLERFVGERPYGETYGYSKGLYDLSYDVLILKGKMEILLESTSNKLMVVKHLEFDESKYKCVRKIPILKLDNPVKEILP
ncbi:hypothetical protein Tco_0520211 [Tanacetum coccineum]